jgi:YggT family protein
MLIIERTYLFIYWLVIIAIVATMTLMVLRLIAIQIDINPFSWSAITLRRLTDPLLLPVRRGLMGLGVDPKYAPVVAILLIILLGWFTLQLVSSMANTLIGVVESVSRQNLIAAIGYIIYGLLGLYSLMIFIRIVFSWGMVSYANPIMKFLVNATEPLLAPLRRIIPPLGMFDISPVVAFVIVWLLQSAVAGTLLRGLRLHFLA